MQYNHLYIYTPTGDIPENEDEHYKIPIKSSRKNPSRFEESESVRLLSELIDPYAARNYWEKNKVVVSPVNPPWNSNISLMNHLDSSPVNGDIDCETSDDECKFEVETDISKSMFKEYLCRYYQVSDIPAKIESKNDGFSLYTRWNF